MATEAILDALRAILDTIRIERAQKLAALDELTSCLLDAVALHDAGDERVCHERCARALDLAYDELGDCDETEHLTALLGYAEPEPS